MKSKSRQPTATARAKTFVREMAVLRLAEVTPRLGVEAGLARVVRDFKWARVSSRALRRWRDAYERRGLAGLVENKRGVVGRKPKRKEA